MSSKIAIQIENLSKCYQIYEQPRDRLKQSLMPRFQRAIGIQPKQYYREFWSLKDISFEVKKGETIGVIGRNGGGKSTLLQIICGTLTPTAGKVACHGRIAALLELGSGFNPEFTGRENVYLNASVLGLSKEEIDDRFDEIVEFADINDFIEQPVKNYSSGMMVRLAFAVAIHVDADILVVDEALSVGDVYFVQKCMRFIREFQSNGGTLIFVSHDTGAVTNLCDRAVYLENGSVKAIGKAKDVVTKYLEKTQDIALVDSLHQKNIASNEKKDVVVDCKTQDNQHVDYRLKFINHSSLRNDIKIMNFEPGSNGFGTGGAKILSVRLLDPINKKDISWLVGGELVCMEISCLANEYIEKPIIGFVIKDRLGQIMFSDNTFLSHQNIKCSANKGQRLTAEFEFLMPVLPNGEYAVSPAIANGTQLEHQQLHWIHDALILKVQSSSVILGLVGLPMKNVDLRVS